MYLEYIFSMIQYIERFQEKKEIWLSPTTKPPIRTENSKIKGQHTNVTKKFDYTKIADRLRTASWSNNSHPTGVVKPVKGYPVHIIYILFKLFSSMLYYFYNSDKYMYRYFQIVICSIIIIVMLTRIPTT